MSAALVAPAPAQPLRPYQSDAIELVRDSMRRGHKRTVLVMPTGSGKTKTAAEIARSAIAKTRRVLWLTHRTELVSQSARALTDLELHVGIVAAGVDADATAPVQVASIQTLVARDTVRPPADLIIIDEAHHMGESSECWVRILDAYPNVHTLGLTATPERGDGTGLAPIFTDLVVGVTVRKLTDLGHLVPCEIDRPGSWLRYGREGNPLAQEPLVRYREIGEQQTGFGFARSVEEAERYAREFTEAGIRSVCVHGKTPDDQRAAAISMFREGRVRIIWNVYVFTEGTDIPSASVCILACNVGTAGGFLQRVGRILRPAPRKTSALLIDLPGVSHLWGPPEDERVYKLDGKGIVRAGQVCRVCGQPVLEYPCPTCGYAPDPDATRDMGTTEIVNAPMQRFARKIAEGPEQRRETFERWCATARAKGHRIRSVGHKWKAVYGQPIENESWWRGWGAV